MIEKIKIWILGLVAAFQAWVPNAPQHFRMFLESAREDPMALIRTPAVRITAMVIGGLFLLGLVSCLSDWISPPGTIVKPADQIPFRVKCENPACKFTGTIMLGRDFHKWPTKCPKCTQKTLQPIVLCYNSTCRKWVVPKIQPDGSRRCPACGAPL